VSLREAAPAKVNLFLHVTGRRGDGYHLLDSLAVFGPAQDELFGASGLGLTLRVEGPFGAGLGEADNWRCRRRGRWPRPAGWRRGRRCDW
jgi:4-diphosphocytidyl-2-C-methyl-D-erythritol kinase